MQALHSPAAERNRGPILAELQRLLPAQGLALEIASGTGQHAAHFAAALPQWRWLPSDVDPQALASISARCQGLANVLPPLLLDILRTPWAGVPAPLDLVFSANLLHIAPWAACAAGITSGSVAGFWVILSSPRWRAARPPVRLSSHGRA